jgi:hypothetical protein
MSDMPSIEYWLPWWWDHLTVNDFSDEGVGDAFPPNPADAGVVQAGAVQPTVLTAPEVTHNGFGRGPPPAAGAAAVAVDEDVRREVERLKKLQERRKRMF